MFTLTLDVYRNWHSVPSTNVNSYESVVAEIIVDEMRGHVDPQSTIVTWPDPILSSTISKKFAFWFYKYTEINKFVTKRPITPHCQLFHWESF